MISCTDFIAAYSELFQFLEKRGGPEAVLAYWEHISQGGIEALRTLVKAHGLRGCFLYWSRTLSEEAADFTLTLDEEAGVFTIDMHHCPSKGRLLGYTHIKPYHAYCRHCDVLYRRVLEPFGFVYEYDQTQCDRACCRLRVTRTVGP